MFFLSAIFWMTRRAHRGRRDPRPADHRVDFLPGRREEGSKSFANRTPPIVSKIKANSPRAMISSVPQFRNLSACIWKEIVTPRKIVIRLASRPLRSLGGGSHACRTRGSGCRTSKKKPTSAAEVRAIRLAINVTMIGNRIRVGLETACG